jgi:hypothetical protein
LAFRQVYVWNIQHVTEHPSLCTICQYRLCKADKQLPYVFYATAVA